MIVRRFFRIVASLLLSIFLLLGFVIIHELGHTVVARIFGDPNSTFYFVRIDENGTCLGCNITDHALLTPVENLLVSIAGFVSTQLVGLGLIAAARWRALSAVVRRWALGTGLAFVILDTFVQGIQELLYDTRGQVWPTNVDFLDAMLLVQEFLQPWPAFAAQAFLKIVLSCFLVIYLFGAVLFFRRTRLLLVKQTYADTDALPRML